MTKTLYDGIDVSKAKVDAATTQDGIKIISSTGFENHLQGLKNCLTGLKGILKAFRKFTFALNQQEFITKSLQNFYKNRRTQS